MTSSALKRIIAPRFWWRRCQRRFQTRTVSLVQVRGQAMYCITFHFTLSLYALVGQHDASAVQQPLVTERRHFGLWRLCSGDAFVAKFHNSSIYCWHKSLAAIWSYNWANGLLFFFQRHRLQCDSWSWQTKGFFSGFSATVSAEILTFKSYSNVRLTKGKRESICNSLPLSVLETPHIGTKQSCALFLELCSVLKWHWYQRGMGYTL